MKAYVRGRSLNVALEEGSEHAAAQLVRRGFTQGRADDVASAALKYAAEETDYLVRQLTPRSIWPGMVVVRRHFIDKREESWLMLRYEGKQGWKLDSAFFA